MKDFYVKFRAKKDKTRQHKRLRNIFILEKHEPEMSNFVNRFLYEIYLELCLCAMIALAKPEIDTNQLDTNTVLAIISLTICLIFAIYVISLYWSRIFDKTRGSEYGHEVVNFIRDVFIGIY